MDVIALTVSVSAWIRSQRSVSMFRFFIFQWRYRRWTLDFGCACALGCPEPWPSLGYYGEIGIVLALSTSCGRGGRLDRFELNRTYISSSNRSELKFKIRLNSKFRTGLYFGLCLIRTE